MAHHQNSATLHEITNDGTPPCLKGCKQAHSPWSAPRERRKRNKQQQEPPALSIIDEIEFASPPKRRNGGENQAPCSFRIALQTKVGAVCTTHLGPLPKGTVAASSLACASGFAPLASGMLPPTFVPGIAPAAYLGTGPLHAHGAYSGGSSSINSCHLSRPEARQPAACRQPSRLATSTPDPPLIEFSQDSQGSQPAPRSQYDMRGWHGDVIETVDTVDQLSSHHQQQQQQQAAPQQALPQHLYGMAAGGPGQQDDGELQARPMGQLTTHTRGRHSDMEADRDLRSSWSSDRSAEITRPWEELQHCAPSLSKPCMRGNALGLRAAFPGVDSPDRAAALRQSVESLGSLDGDGHTVVSERQVSILPLRSAAHGGSNDASQLSSPAPSNGASVTPRRGFFGGGSRASSGPRLGCFPCVSPFGGCRGRSSSDAEDEVVRRDSNAAEFVIRSKDLPASGTMARRRQESLSQPSPSPSSEQDLVHRQRGFSARFGAAPAGWSPRSAASDESLATSGATSSMPGTARREQVAIDHGMEDMLSALKSTDAPSVDMLNDMLRAFCTVDAHPRDAEDLVQEACKQGGLVPNATTLRTLDKIWAAHEQYANS